MSSQHARIGCLSSLLIVAWTLPASAGRSNAASSAESATPELALSVDRAGHQLSFRGTVFHTTLRRIEQLRLIEVPDAPVRLILWEEVGVARQSVPFYAISLDGHEITRVRQTSYTVKLRHGDFDPAGAVPPVHASLTADPQVNLYIVQFVTQPLEEFRTAIRDLGGRVYNFLAQHAHIVKMSPQTRDQVAALPFVRWVGPYHPAYRLEEFMLHNRDRAAELFPSQRYNVQVFEAGLGQKTAVAERIEALGGAVDKLDAGKFLLMATLTPPQLFEVVRWDQVLFVDRWSPYEADMNNARVAGGANYIESVGGYTGGGVRGEVFDIGFNLSHVDFASRPLITHGSVGSDTHGAATSGICFGDGTGDINARGLLPDGQGIVADPATVGMTGPSRYNHTGQLVQSPYFAVFQTSSVGSGLTTQYTSISSDTDAALFDFDIVHCQSQSNAGSQSSRPQAWAKNIISGGGIRHYNTLSTTDDCWCGGASIGPAADGRIKPDLCAYYDDIRTTTCCGPTAYTSSFGGTSGATPIIAGHVGLFFDMWADGAFGNVVPVPGGTVFENRSHMTTAKAMLIHTATQYPFSGTGQDLTRVHQGWGWPDLERMYDQRLRLFIIDETEVLGNLGRYQRGTDILPGETTFRATLVYADPPGTTSSSQHRINDLTLKLTSPSDVIYWGNNGLLAGNWSTPGGSANTKDTVENVIIQNPEAGIWTIEVIADEINQDGHVETPQLDVDFALIVTCDLCQDCNNNGVPDIEDIANGTSIDCNFNGIPDECEGDFCTPTPDPITWEVPPTPVSTSAITMAAVEAVDDTPPVEYFYLYWPGVGTGGSSRFYDPVRTYTDTGLQTNMVYTYSVRARDSASSPNTGDESPPGTAATHIETPTGISFGPVTDTSIQVTAEGTFTFLTGSLFGEPPNQSGIFFEMTPAGGIGATEWVTTQTITVTGLTPGTAYTFRVKARNYLGLDETPWVGPAVQSTTGAAPCPLLGDVNEDGFVRGDDIAGFVRAKVGQAPEPGDNPACANYGGTLEEDIAAFTLDLLGS